MTLTTAITKAESLTDVKAKVNRMKKAFTMLTKTEFKIFFMYYIEIGMTWGESLTWAREEALKPLPKVKLIKR